MGEYANYQVQNFIRYGMKFKPNYIPQKRPRCSCVICKKEVEASEGLQAHQKTKHEER